MTMTPFYHIRVRGHLDTGWSEWFEGMTVTHEPNEMTVIAGPVRDQAALFGMLVKIRDLGLTLIAVNHISGDHQENN